MMYGRVPHVKENVNNSTQGYLQDEKYRLNLVTYLISLSQNQAQVALAFSFEIIITFVDIKSRYLTQVKKS